MAPFEVATDIDPRPDTQPWTDAGANWVLTSFGPVADPGALRQAIHARC